MSILQAVTNRAVAKASPFTLDNTPAYRAWREAKLHAYPQQADELLFPIDNPHALTVEEKTALLQVLKKTNMAIYRLKQPETYNDKSLVVALGKQFGLNRLDSNLCADEDSITSLTVVGEGRHKGYIPYSNRPLNWHTDGYYNTGEDQIRGIILHCVLDAVDGGDNALMDHEMVYLLMRDESPALVEAMMADDAMSIPPNNEGGEEIRGTSTGPVFSLDRQGNLHMRYTARKRNIEWKNDTATQEAVAFLEELMGSDSPYIFRHHLQPGEGLLCNNILHTRTRFEDDEQGHGKRLLYRARYFDRIADTDIGAIGE